MSDRTHELPKLDLVGQVVGGVTIEAVLSQTERGLVLLGSQMGVDRPAVVKIFPKARTNSDADKRLFAEAGALSQLRHANVVTLYSVGIHDERFPYLLMEFVPGETLKSLLHREGSVTPARALGIVLQIVNAIEEIHRLGLRHGTLGIHSVRVEELKGSNQDLVKLVGFGLEMDTGGSDDRVWYMTPEECTGGMYTEQSDIYVCGVILYQLLTGHMPYRSANLEGLWDEVVTDTPPPIALNQPDLAALPQLQELTDSMLAKVPAARPRGARSLRLLITSALTALKNQNDQPGTRKAEAFPVIHTVERMVSLPREAPAAFGSVSAGPRRVEKEPGTGTLDTTMASLLGMGMGSEPEVGRILARELAEPPAESADPGSLEVDIGGLLWRVGDEVRFRASEKKRYAVLVVHRPRGRVPSDFTQQLNVIMTSPAGPGTFFFVVAPSKNPEAWLPWVAARARQFGLLVGLSMGKGFDADTRNPASYSVRMALQAARSAEVSQIIAGRHAVDRLGLSSLFVEFADDRRSGRYSSFLRYAGISGA